MIIKKIFEGVFDEEVHSDLLKFGRGEYKNKYLLEGKKQSDKWAIKTGPEFANFLVRSCLKKINKEVELKGVIVSTLDLERDIDFEIEKKSNFQGIKKLSINTKIHPDKILNLMEKYPRVFYALSFKGADFDLKIKPKPPKSAKPGAKPDKKVKADFCSLKTNDKDIVEELFFDYPSFKEISVNHTIKINEIIYPENMGDLSPSEIRERSKRKGVLIRMVKIDGKDDIKQANFIA